MLFRALFSGAVTFLQSDLLYLAFDIDYCIKWLVRMSMGGVSKWNEAEILRLFGVVNRVLITKTMPAFKSSRALEKVQPCTRESPFVHLANCTRAIGQSAPVQ